MQIFFFIFVTISAYRYLVDGRLLITVGQVYIVTLLFPSFDRSFWLVPNDSNHWKMWHCFDNLDKYNSQIRQIQLRQTDTKPKRAWFDNNIKKCIALQESKILIFHFCQIISPDRVGLGLTYFRLLWLPSAAFAYPAAYNYRNHH